MSLQERISKDLSVSMKKKDLAQVKVLRFLQSAIKNKAISLRPEPLKEEHIFAVLRKLIKQVKESLEHYKKASYKEQVLQDEFQLSVLESYLPKALCEEELQVLVKKTIKELEAKSIQEMGHVMKSVLSQTKGSVEAKVLSQIVRHQLSNS